MLWDHEDLVTGAIGARRLGIRPSLVCNWVVAKKLAPVGNTGRSPIYRYGDLLDVERATRLTRHSSRNEDRIAEHAAIAA